MAHNFRTINAQTANINVPALSLGAMEIKSDGTMVRHVAGGFASCNVFEMGMMIDQIISNMAILESKLAEMQQVVGTMSQRVEELYYCPGMPGYMLAQKEFEQCRATAPERAE